MNKADRKKARRRGKEVRDADGNITSKYAQKKRAEAKERENE